MTVQMKNELLFGARFLLRDNALTGHYLRQLQRNARLDSEQLAQYQLQRLHHTLQTAIGRLPYYAHISPAFSVAESAQVLRQAFPIIGKEQLLAERAALYPGQGHKRPWQALGKTSGTTGTPLDMFRSLRSVLLEQAFVQRHWSWAGYHAGMTRATLRGDMVTPLARQRPPFWFWNRWAHQLLVSSRHLTARHADAIIDRLAALAPAMLQAYPSTAYTLAGLLQQRQRRLRIPYVFTASEPTYPHQRELITEWLGAKLMDMYGMAERVAFATECEHGELHVNTDYSYVEIVDRQGLPTDDFGSVVGTTFHNDAMPLVRYRLSDQTRWKPGRCACGRAFPMIERVTGKYEDSIRGGDGAVISPSVLTFAFKGVHNVLKSQVAQVAPARWEIRVVPGPQFGEPDRQQLVHNVHALVDPTVEVQVVLRDELPNTAAGKFRWVVNEMPAHG
ncbi:phenylacetate--CoA ligase family protein [Duganella sp. FT3S]|uniref:Phenylacetate--CoA ligase family protein n=1 Tax=Rugamonas fusca TaxID=2758568 RepID=A0A7W2I8G6_9BURK|nr:phenylacetate--CoA ligase family protein [Rugamonas fusca]MBA5607592.1 phenylacetate--CoA ligase family protein [Rugamonas fusca]